MYGLSLRNTDFPFDRGALQAKRFRLLSGANTIFPTILGKTEPYPPGAASNNNCFSHVTATLFQNYTS